MSHFEIADAYGEADKILDKAELATVHTHPVWQKVYRVKQYLRKQAEAELAEVLA